MSAGRKKILKKSGKTRVREQLAPLVEDVSISGGIVKVTNHRLAGSAFILSDLNEASYDIAASIFDSLAKSAREL